jgi:hypothetical protein
LTTLVAELQWLLDDGDVERRAELDDASFRLD